jgi:N-acetylglucosaminyltransferase
MYTAYWQLQLLFETGEWRYFLVYFILANLFIWPRIWLRRRFERQVRMGMRDYPKRKYCVSAIVPVYSEGKRDFERCLRTLKRSLEYGTEAYEIIVLLDGVEPRAFGKPAHMTDEERVARKYATRILKANHRMKRKNLRDMVRRAQGDILLMVDSDTFFERSTVFELCLPFADPRMGGVTTRQAIYRPKTRMQRAFNWMENGRAGSSMPATALYYQVACLPGRAIAILKRAIEKHMDALVDETFFGRQCVSGDDRKLTNALLKDGWRTTFANKARVFTLAPATFRQGSTILLRWARSSIRYTLQTLYWLWRYPVALYIYVTDILLAPMTTYLVLWEWPRSVFFRHDLNAPFWQLVIFTVTGALLMMSVRQLYHLRRNPKDIWFLPTFMVIATYLQILRTYALVTLFKVNVWGSRAGADARGTRTCVHFDSGPVPMTTPVAQT